MSGKTTRTGKMTRKCSEPSTYDKKEIMIKSTKITIKTVENTDTISTSHYYLLQTIRLSVCGDL